MDGHKSDQEETRSGKYEQKKRNLIDFKRIRRKSANLFYCDKIFIYKASGKYTNPDGFQEMRKFIREGDIVVVTELKQLGGNNKELIETINIVSLKT